MNKFAKTIIACMAFCQIACNVFADTGDIADTGNIKSKDIPFGQASYYHFAKDQRLSDLIRDFCSMQSISVVISPQIVDVVNGKFSKMTPNDFWNYVTRAYGLSWFYDGRILYVYAINEIKTQIFKMGADESVTLSNLLASLDFVSSDFSFRPVPNANILLVTASPRYLEVINELAMKFSVDRLSDSAIVRTFPLKYAWAYDMSLNYAGGSLTVPGVATMLRNILMGDQQQAPSTFTTSVGNHQATRINPMIMEHENPYSPQRVSINIHKESADNAKEQVTQNNDQQRSPQIIGMITYDTRLNAIIIKDKRENMQFYEDIISQLDVSCDILKIDVAIVDLTKTDQLEFGLRPEFKFEHKNDKSESVTDGTIRGYKVDRSDRPADLKKISNLFGQTIRGVINKKTLSAYLQAEETNGRTKTIARPSVLTLDNVGAIIEKDQTVYKSVAGKDAGNLFNVTATTKLQVVPHIIPGVTNELGSKKIKMFVDISDASLSGLDNENSEPQADSSTISTQAVLWEGQCLLIGGYFNESIVKSVSGIPILKQIPIIGSLFSVKNNKVNITERLYIIYPTVVDTDKPMSQFDAIFEEVEWDKKDLTVTKVNNFKLNAEKAKERQIARDIRLAEAKERKQIRELKWAEEREEKLLSSLKMAEEKEAKRLSLIKLAEEKKKKRAEEKAERAAKEREEKRLKNLELAEKKKKECELCETKDQRKAERVEKQRQAKAAAAKEREEKRLSRIKLAEDIKKNRAEKRKKAIEIITKEKEEKRLKVLKLAEKNKRECLDCDNPGQIKKEPFSKQQREQRSKMSKYSTKRIKNNNNTSRRY